MAKTWPKTVQKLFHSLPQFVAKIKSAARGCCQATKLVSKPLLNGKFALHDIRDVEMFCGRIIDRSGLELSHHDSEDLLAFLVETAWELSLRYDRGDLPSCFSNYATSILSRRVADFQRKAGGGRTRWQFADRTYERELPRFVQVDDELPGSVSSSDSGADGLRGIVRARSRQRARHLADLRTAMRQRTAA